MIFKNYSPKLKNTKNNNKKEKIIIFQMKE